MSGWASGSPWARSCPGSRPASFEIVGTQHCRLRRHGNIAGLACTAVVTFFLAFDAGLKLLRLAPAVEGTTVLGYPAESVMWIGAIELVCLALYLVPRTAVLGALLMTGYLGGAVATHVRISSPLLTHTLFPIYVALLLWAGLYLREERLRALVPLRR